MYYKSQLDSQVDIYIRGWTGEVSEEIMHESEIRDPGHQFDRTRTRVGASAARLNAPWKQLSDSCHL